MTFADPTINNLYDPGLHLFVDDAEVQDHPGFMRKIQRPTRVQPDPVLRPERPWEGKTVQIKGGYRYNRETDPNARVEKRLMLGVILVLIWRDRSGDRPDVICRDLVPNQAFT